MFSLAGHLTRNREKKILFYCLCISPHPTNLNFLIWHLKEAVICQVITFFLESERVQLLLGELWLFWHKK